MVEWLRNQRAKAPRARSMALRVAGCLSLGAWMASNAGELAPGVRYAGEVARTKARRARWGAGCETAMAALRGMEPGDVAAVLTDATASLVEYLEVLLEDAAPCTLDLSTWSIYRGDLARLMSHVDAGRITGLRIAVDRGFRQRRPDDYAATVAMLGAERMREVRLHAKLFILDGGPGRVWAGASSMNLNGNSRVENLAVMCSEEIAACYRGLFDLVWSSVAVGESSSVDPLRETMGATSGGQQTLLQAMLDESSEDLTWF